MSKEAANLEYRKKLEKYKYKVWPNEPNVAVFGVNSDNIGGRIYECLAPACKADAYDVFQVRLPDLPRNVDEYDAFVFNNGLNHLDWLEDWSEEMIDSVIHSCMTSTILAISAIAKIRMNNRNRTKIVVIGSMAHSKVLNGSAAYCAAKAGLMHFVRCAAYELAPKGFEVFCVNPSNVQDSPMSEATIAGLARYRHLSLDDARAYWGAECPMGEFLTKDEIADIVAELILGDRKYLSGTAIDLIGGQR